MITEKLQLLLKAAFASSDGSAVTLPYGKGQQPDASPLKDLTGYLSAMPPLPAMGPRDYDIRSRDFRIAENLDYIPGGGKFPVLRTFADRWNVLRSLLDTKKDRMAAYTWEIKPKPGPGETRADVTKRAKSDPVVQELTTFFQLPDGERTWFQWIRQFLEEVYVLDAGCVQMCRDSKGRIAKCVIVSGDTINRVIDDRGWTPEPEQVAYQQVLSGAGEGPEGVPQINLTQKDLLYFMRNPRASRKWGQSSVEKIYKYVITGILADDFIQDYYTAGNQPPGFLLLGNMTPAQVDEYDKKFNAVYAGNLQAKRRIAMLPAGVGDSKSVQFIPTKEQLLQSAYYEDMIRYACYELSLSNVPLSKPMNRASANASQTQAADEGDRPDLVFLTNFMNRIIQHPFYFGLENYEWVPGPRRDVDPLKQAQVDKIYVSCAVESVNEVRADIGKEPFKIAEADEPGVMTPNNGFVPLDGTKATQVLQARQQSNNPANNSQPGKFGQSKPQAPVNKVAFTNSVTMDMPPMEFLGKLGDTLETVLATELDQNKVAEIRRKMRAGEQQAPSQLDLDADGKVTGHDGRHRAVAAFLEGHEEIPVIVTSPIPVEKASASPAHLTSASKKARTSLEERMSTVLKTLREKTLREIAHERILRGRKNG